jgi:hypothetical protein
MWAPWCDTSVTGLILQRAKGVRMEIGKPLRKIVVEPIRDPVPPPAPKPEREPARTMPSPRRPVRR